MRWIFYRIYSISRHSSEHLTRRDLSPIGNQMSLCTKSKHIHTSTPSICCFFYLRNGGSWTLLEPRWINYAYSVKWSQAAFALSSSRRSVPRIRSPLHVQYFISILGTWKMCIPYLNEYLLGDGFPSLSPGPFIGQDNADRMTWNLLLMEYKTTLLTNWLGTHFLRSTALWNR